MVSFTREEIEFIENLKVSKAKTSMEIKDSQSYYLNKMSKDRVVVGFTMLVKKDGDWYWDSEEPTEDSLDEDKIYDYVCKLPKSIGDKLNATVNQSE